ncbi:MAG: gliding motility-associated protein GldE [Flavobacteriales bacterium]
MDFLNPHIILIGGLFLAMMATLIGAALISSTEVALFGLNSRTLDLLELRHNKSGKAIRKLLEEPEKLLANILITNSLFHISFVFISTAFIGELKSLGMASVIPTWAQIVIISIFLILFGEIIPKVLATKKGEKIAVFMATPMFVLNYILKPFSAFLSLFHGRKKKEEKKSSTLSVDELSAVHELIQNKQGSEQEQKILSGILNFGNTDVKQVMTPRTNIIALDESHSFHMVLKEIQASGFSRIPMYEDNIDKITGVLYIKDLLPYLEENDSFQWQQFKRNAYFIPESKKLDDLLKEFQEMKMHVAVVVDEYGGTSGIISLEDVIEEIVGDLNDEYDDENIVYSKLDDRNYIFDGKTLLVDMYRILDLDETLFEAAKGEADTIAGFILEQTGVFPKKDASIDFGSVKFKIDSIDKRRIISVKITLVDGKI